MEKKTKYDKNHQTKNHSINITQFDETDIQRSQIVNEILDIYNNYDEIETNKKGNDDSALIPLDHVKTLRKHGYNEFNGNL